MESITNNRKLKDDRDTTQRNDSQKMPTRRKIHERRKLFVILASQLNGNCHLKLFNMT